MINFVVPFENPDKKKWLILLYHSRALVKGNGSFSFAILKPWLKDIDNFVIPF
jgi:hypothetical protein